MRQWTSALAAGALVSYLLGTALVFQVHPFYEAAQNARYRTTPLALLNRGGSFFTALGQQDHYAHVLNPLAPAFRIILLVLVAVLTYGLARRITRDTGLLPAAALGASAVLISAGATDAVMVVVYAVRQWQTQPASHAVPAATRFVNDLATTLWFWHADALFLGMWAVVPAAGLFGVSHLGQRMWTPDHGIRSFATGRRFAANLASAGVVPMLALAFVNGADMDDANLSSADLLSRETFPLYLRLFPPSSPDVGHELTHPGQATDPVSIDEWATRTWEALFFLALIWIILWLVLAALPRAGARWSTFLAAFGGTILGCIAAGLLLVAILAPSLAPTKVSPLILGVLPVVMRMGVVWGWPGALLVLLARYLLCSNVAWTRKESTWSENVPVDAADPGAATAEKDSGNQELSPGGADPPPGF